jgi:hypothetical protein
MQHPLNANLRMQKQPPRPKHRTNPNRINLRVNTKTTLNLPTKAKETNFR